MSVISTTAVTANNAVNHIKHVSFNASFAGGSPSETAISGVLSFKTVSNYVPMQGIAGSSGITYNFYFNNIDHTVNYAQQTPADRYYFDLLMYAE